MKTTEKPKKFVAYYRVSTERQGISGLGLDAQRKAVLDYLNGGRWELLAERVEVESGKKAARPELKAAIEEAKKAGATLIIARLDRLARNVHFVSGLMESGVDFVAVDNPHASRLIIHVMAAFAEHEREQISSRTKAALAQAKARGVKLGKHGKVLARQNQEAAQKHAETLRPVVEAMQAEGISTVRAICDELNRRRIPGAKGGLWHLPAAHRLITRLQPRRKKGRKRGSAAKAKGKE